MIKLLAVPICLLISMAAHSGGVPDSINYYSEKGVEVTFVDLHDPGDIVLKLKDGETIRTTYSGVDFETLWAWEKEQNRTGKMRKLDLIYTNESGVQVYDKKSGITFTLSGTMDKHPIDRALKQCRKEHATTIGISDCKQLALIAWDSELKRAYKNLGGDENAELEKAMVAWIKFRNAQIKYLRDEYGKRNGTIWGLVYMDHVIDITKNQAKVLKCVSEW